MHCLHADAIIRVVIRKGVEDVFFSSNQLFKNMSMEEQNQNEGVDNDTVDIGHDGLVATETDSSEVDDDLLMSTNNSSVTDNGASSNMVTSPLENHLSGNPELTNGENGHDALPVETNDVNVVKIELEEDKKCTTDEESPISSSNVQESNQNDDNDNHATESQEILESVDLLGLDETSNEVVDNENVESEVNETNIIVEKAQDDQNNDKPTNGATTESTAAPEDDQSQQKNLSLEEQIQILTQERDAAQQVNKELLQQLSSNTNQNDTNNAQEDSILVELQASLQSQMTRRAEAEHQLKTLTQKLSTYETKLNEYSDMEDQIELLQTNMTQIMASKTQLEQEVSTLRTFREESEHNAAILSNRLNEAKKKEANKASTADRLVLDNQSLKDEIQTLQNQLESMMKQKEKLETSMEKLKKKCIERIQLTENALGEERNLNEERKKKMKLFVEQKAEELRNAKITNDEIQSDLQKTSDALNHVRTKLHHMTELYESTSTKNRELIREMARIKKNTEQLHNLGSNLELELHKSAQETEEHKQKRNTAKHELMTMLRKLEAEQAVSEKLRDSIKFTFTPKALSQQQLLNESLEDFETELLKLSRRLGKTLPPKLGPNGDGAADASTVGIGGNSDIPDESSGVKNDDEGLFNGGGNDGSAKKKNGKINSRSEFDTTRLLTNLEHETQQVSKEIMALNSAVERLHILLDDSGEKTCVSTLNELFGAMASGGNSAATTNISQNTNTINFNSNYANTGSVSQYDDENDSFTGTPVKRRAERYGLVQPGN